MGENSFRETLKLNDQQKVRIYEKFKSQQENQFELYINYINEVLCILKDYRIVSDFTRFTARTKATQSAIENDGKKALDDVFGMEIDYGTIGERDFVTELIKSTLHIGKEKIHDKDNGYQAYHCSGYPISDKSIVDSLELLINREINPDEEYRKYYDSLSEKQKKKVDKKKIVELFTRFKKHFELFSEATKRRLSEKYIKQLRRDLKRTETVYLEQQRALIKKEGSTNYIPIIELQAKTIEVAIKSNIGQKEIRHDHYKGQKTENVQKIYDKLEGNIPLSEVPTMYKSSLRRDSEGRIIPPRLLSSDETLKILYPDLIVKPKIRGEQK